jgi:DNA-directed RNA polymerase subunit RPC12/RpoP
MNETVRRTLYSNHGVKMLLRHMLSEEHELVPEYDQNVGFRYPQAEEFITGPVTETLYLIRKLYEAGILLKKYRDKAVACPSCLSPAISVKYLCVSCSSSNIEKRQVLEHVPCSFSDVEESFRKDGEWVCPKCGRTIGKDELRGTESNFHCRDCGESFDKPTWMHNCKKCRFNFTLNEANFIDVYTYVLSDDVRSELEAGTMSLMPLRLRFEKYGFAVSTPSSLKGKSGSVHPFDLIGRGTISGKDSIVALDLVYSPDPLDMSPVSSLMGKLIDTEVDLGILVVIPGINQTGKNLAQLYDIEIIEAESSKEAADEFEKRLKTFVRRAL